jgi:phage-related protein
LIEDGAGGTYRAVYTGSYSSAVYVLHVFQKKSKTRQRGQPAPACADFLMAVSKLRSYGAEAD